MAGGAALGRDFRAPLQYGRWMADAGFVDVAARQVLVPVSAWPADPLDAHLGGWFALDAQKGVRGTAKLLEAAGMRREDVHGFMDEVCSSVGDEALRAYSPRK